MDEPGESRLQLSRSSKILRWFAIALTVVALGASAGLLGTDVKGGEVPGLTVHAISALPLLAVGLSFLIIQPMLRPRWGKLLKNILLAATFLLWGIVQLMAQNTLSKRLGDLVIALYVVDLAWTILSRVKAPIGEADD